MFRIRALPNFQHNLFFLALFVYGVFGSPTPDSFGVAEVIIGLLLVLSLEPRLDRLSAAESLFLIYGLSVPVIFALINFASMTEIMRDMIPFIFLLMPVLYYWRGLKDAKYLSWGITCIGLAFAMRSLWTFGADIFTPSSWLGTPPNLLYLANSPEVLFAAIFLLDSGFGRNVRIERRIFYFCLALCPLLAMATLVQRASSFYVAFAAIISYLAFFIKNPQKAVKIGIVVIIACLPLYPFIADIVKQLSFKNQVVGLNSRGAEWHAVFGQIFQSPDRFLFGIGWGGEFENPAVGGLRVNYTHSLLSSLLLKTGITGVILFLSYAFYLLRISILKRPWRRISGDVFYLCALVGPLLIGLCLYASYKSLGYGLLLLLFSSFADGKRLEDTKPAVS